MNRTIFKGLLFCLCTLLVKQGFSQVTYGVFAGGQFTTAKYKIRDAKQPTGFQKGLQFGGTMKIPFDNNLYFAPAIYYSQKGYQVNFRDTAYPPTQLAVNNQTVIHTVEIVPMLHYDFGKKPSHLFLKLGPAIDFVFSGEEQFDLVDGKTVKRPMPFSFSDYGRITAQAILHFGYESSKGFMLFAHYGEGLGSLNNADGGPIIKHRIVGLSFGWFFHRNPNVIDTRVKE